MKFFDKKGKRLSFIKKRLSTDYKIKSIEALNRLPAGFSLTYIPAGGISHKYYQITITDNQKVLCVISMLFGTWIIGGRFYVKIEVNNSYKRLNL